MAPAAAVRRERVEGGFGLPRQVRVRVRGIRRGLGDTRITPRPDMRPIASHAPLAGHGRRHRRPPDGGDASTARPPWKGRPGRWILVAQPRLSPQPPWIIVWNAHSPFRLINTSA